jgi:hypothetical protein
MRTRRAFRPVLETMPTLVLTASTVNPVAPVTVPTTPPPSTVNPVAPVTVPPASTDYPYSGPDVNPPASTTPVLDC